MVCILAHSTEHILRHRSVFGHALQNRGLELLDRHLLEGLVQIERSVFGYWQCGGGSGGNSRSRGVLNGIGLRNGDRYRLTNGDRNGL